MTYYQKNNSLSINVPHSLLLTSIENQLSYRLDVLIFNMYVHLAQHNNINHYNSFFAFVVVLFNRQSVGTNCAPFLAVLFLYAHKTAPCNVSKGLVKVFISPSTT